MCRSVTTGDELASTGRSGIRACQARDRQHQRRHNERNDVQGVSSRIFHLIRVSPLCTMAYRDVSGFLLLKAAICSNTEQGSRSQTIAMCCSGRRSEPSANATTDKQLYTREIHPAQ